MICIIDLELVVQHDIRFLFNGRFIISCLFFQFIKSMYKSKKWRVVHVRDPYVNPKMEAREGIREHDIYYGPCTTPYPHVVIDKQPWSVSFEL